MSVFTPVNTQEVTDFLREYPVGELQSFEGISAGIENSNFFVNTTDGRWVMTIFETVGASELPFCLGLTGHLAASGVPSPAPVKNRDGQLFGWLKGKPAALVQRLSGSEAEPPGGKELVAIGNVLADLHQSAMDFDLHRDNTRGPDWWNAIIPTVLTKASPADAELLVAEQQAQAGFDRSALPEGVNHADLFRDNALFENGKLAGLIDFYYACNDALLYDVAVTVNDWCRRDDNSIDRKMTKQLLDAYHQRRPLNAREQEAWPMMLRAATLRFWVSRLKDFHFPREGEMTHAKNPDEFRDLLQWHHQNDCYFPAIAD